MNLIHGKHVFRVAGFNMVLDDEGAAAYLENGIGTTFPLAVDEVVSKQLFKAHTAELLPAGDYKLVVKSRAGDAGGPLQTSFRKVKYLRVVDPEPEPVPIAQSSDGQVKVTSVDNEGHTEYLTFGETWTMTGSGLVTGIEEGVRWIPDVALQCPGAEGFEGHFLRLTPSADGKTMTLSPNPDQPTPPSGTYENARLSMMTIKDDEQEVLDIPIKLVVGE